MGSVALILVALLVILCFINVGGDGAAPVPEV